MRRPVPFAALAATVLILAGIPFTSIRFTGIDASVLPEGVSSRAVDDALRSEFRSAGVSPAYAVVRGSAQDAAAYARAVRALPAARRRAAASQARADDVGDRSCIGRAVPRAGVAPHGPRHARAASAAPVGGATAQFLDQKRAIVDGLPLAIGLLCVATFLLLYVATRSLILPLKTLLMNALSISATLGILVARVPGGPLREPPELPRPGCAAADGAGPDLRDLLRARHRLRRLSPDPDQGRVGLGALERRGGRGGARADRAGS